MNFGQVLTTIEDYKQAGISLETLTTLINDTFGDWLASQVHKSSYDVRR